MGYTSANHLLNFQYQSHQVWDSIRHAFCANSAEARDIVLLSGTAGDVGHRYAQ